MGELADQLPVSRPAVSQHLRVPDQLDTYWNRALAGFEATIDDDSTEDGT